MQLLTLFANVLQNVVSFSRHTRLRRFARPTHQRFERRKQATSREATYSRRSFLNLKYTTEISWPIGLALPSNEKRVLTTVEADILQLPRGSKILPLARGSTKAKDIDQRQVRVGVYRSPGEFEQEACNLTHPFDGSSAVSDNAKRAIFFLLTEGRDKLREARESVFAHYERLADALADDEAAIHESMDPLRERLVRDKKFLLFKHMCKDAGIEDDFLVDLLVNGVKLTGCWCSYEPVRIGPQGAGNDCGTAYEVYALDKAQSSWVQFEHTGRSRRKRSLEGHMR